MDIYVCHGYGNFKYKSLVVPRCGEIIIFEPENEAISQHFRVLSVVYYTNGEYNEVHIEAKLEKEEKVE